MWLKRGRQDELWAVRESGLFDAGWYRSQFQGAPPSGDLLSHYIEHGLRLGYSPSPHFDPQWYLQAYPDVAANGINPLLHYVLSGRAEGRTGKRPEQQEALAELQRQQQEDVAVLRREIEQLRAANEDFKAQIAYIHDLFNEAADEPKRLDFALCEMEGMGALRDELSAARKTAEFQAAFDDPSPLITVVTGTTERSKLLVERCLKSIREQTYSNLQILVIGDHCIDDTAERIAELNDPRIEFHNLPKRGPYPRPGKERWMVAGTHAANVSRKLARGQFVTFLDDDDAYEPDRIETLLAVARETRAEFIWHKFWALMEDGSWRLWGSGKFEKGQIGGAMVFCHRFFQRIPYDLHAYRIPEPGDWNWLRKIKHLRPVTAFVDKPLMRYFRNYEVTPFVAQDGEEFLD